MTANGVVILTIGAGGVRGITRFLDAALPPRFGFPETQPVEPDR